MKPEQIINFKAVSRHLTGDPFKARNNCRSKKMKQPIEDLCRVVEKWMEQYPPEVFSDGQNSR